MSNDFLCGVATGVFLAGIILLAHEVWYLLTPQTRKWRTITRGRDAKTGRFIPVAKAQHSDTAIIERRKVKA